LEHPGELVTREELQKRLWPADTFVHFDRGLNAAINRVREALGDSAENPRFVEILPRRGYRFIGQVDRAEQANSTESQASVNRQRNGIAGRGWKIGIAAGSVILLIASGLLFSSIAATGSSACSRTKLSHNHSRQSRRPPSPVRRFLPASHRMVAK
jgi:hypothetical protein